MIYTSTLSFLSIIYFCFTLKTGEGKPKVKIRSVFTPNRDLSKKGWVLKTGSLHQGTKENLYMGPK